MQSKEFDLTAFVDAEMGRLESGLSRIDPTIAAEIRDTVGALAAAAIMSGAIVGQNSDVVSAALRIVAARVATTDPSPVSVAVTVVGPSDPQ